MALLWFDGFSSYADRGESMDILNSPVFTNVVIRGDYIDVGTDVGRDGRYGIMILYHDRYIQYSFADNYTSFIIGAAMKRGTTAPTYSSSFPGIAFIDGTTEQLGIYAVGEELHVYVNSSKIGETSGAGLADGVWKYIEIKVVIDNSAGSIVIRSNEEEVLSLTSQDTQVTANAYFNRLDINGMYNTVDSYYADLYMCDLTGGAPHNDFLGDVRVDRVTPDGAGTHTDFTPSAGSNFQNVDEVPAPDGDTTYNDGDTVGHQDSYGLPALPSPAGTTIYGVKDQITVRKTDAGAMECKILTVQGGSDYLGSAINLSDAYTTHARIMAVNPDDSAAFEDADISGGEVGVEVTA